MTTYVALRANQLTPLTEAQGDGNFSTLAAGIDTNAAAIASLTLPATSVNYTGSGTGSVSRSVQSKLSETISLLDFAGVDPTGVSDSTAGIQAFFTSVTTNGLFGRIPKGNYLVSYPLVINIGSIGFNIEGVASTAVNFIISSSFSGGTNALQLLGASNTVGWSLGGFSVIPQSTSGTATTGFAIGNPSAAVIAINGYQFSAIQDVNVNSFATCWNIYHARMIFFSRCGGWNTGVSGQNTVLNIAQNGAFTGDLLFDKCQFVTNNANANTNLTITSPVGPYNNSNGNNSISGIKFRDCDFYGGYQSAKVYATAGSYVSDIWFSEGCQFDQQTYNDIYIESNGSATLVEDIHINHAYLNKSTNTSVVVTSTGGYIKSVWINDCEILQPTNKAISVYGNNCIDIHVNDNVVEDCAAAGSAIEFNGVMGVQCSNNTARTGNLNQRPYYLLAFDAGTTNIVAMGNNGYGAVNIGTLLDNSGSTVKRISDNLGFNPIAPTSITFTGSPMTYTNNTGNTVMGALNGGTISSVTLEGYGITYISSMTIPIPQGTSLVVAYTAAPSLNIFGL